MKEIVQLTLRGGESRRARLVRRLRRVEGWRRARFQRLLDGHDRERAIRAARLYLEVGTRRMAVERELIS